MKTTRKVISTWKKLHKGQQMEMVVYITTNDDGSKSSRTAHEQVKK
jgi:hypothetical protein